MSNPIQTVPTQSGGMHRGIAPGAADDQNDTQAWERRCEELIQERRRLRMDPAQSQAERDAYVKAVYHYLCKDYTSPPLTKEEILARLDGQLTFDELIAELKREAASRGSISRL